MSGVMLRAAARHAAGLRLWLAEVPQGARLLPLPPLEVVLSASVEGVALLVAEGPPAPLPPLRLALERFPQEREPLSPILTSSVTHRAESSPVRSALAGSAGRLLTELRLPDPPRGDPSAALAEAPPALCLALLAAPGAAPLVAAPPLPLGWLSAWAGALPVAAGEALASPTGEALAWLPGGGRLAAALLPRPDGGLRAAEAGPARGLAAGGGVLLSMQAEAAPALLLLDTPGGLRRLAPRAAIQPALAAALARAARRLAPEAAGAFLAEAAVARAARAGPLPGVPTEIAPAGPSGPPVLLLAGAADPFARRLLFLAAPDLARRFAEILLFGPQMQAEAAWLAGRLRLPLRAAPPLAEAARRSALARATLVPAGPGGLAEALGSGGAEALLARALPGAALASLVALAAAEGDDEAAVLRLAGEAA
jgi:hypothetical protein